MKIATTLFLFVVVGCTWRGTIGTCVLESDFGFTLNCAFKKSGLFRVRNLGGVKGYVGLGFSVGDELGFRESLSNLESNKRRSVQTGRGNVIPIVPSNTATNRNDPRQIAQNAHSVPPFKPLPPGGVRPIAQQPERQKLVVQQNSTVLRTVAAPSLTTMQEEVFRRQQLAQQEEKLRQQQQRLQEEERLRKQQQRMQEEEQLRKQQQKMQQEAFALQVLKQQQMQQQEAMRQQQMQKNAQQQIVAMQAKRMQMAQTGGTPSMSAGRLPNIVTAVAPGRITMSKPVAGILASDGGLPPFVAMPQSSAQLTDRISNSPTLLTDSVNEVPKDDFSQLPIPGEDAIKSVNQLTLRSIQSAAAAQQSPQHSQKQAVQQQEVMSPVSLPSLASIQDMEPSLKALAEASNITLEALETAILLRQQQLLKKHQEPVTTTTTTTSTASPISKYNSGSPTKVMNAPREYYPVGYDKNFDDHFASRVDLPDTSFYCGDQKHFPGLYADEDLGCMVFHVCALTDDGLIMKSFLCPESTLFDQTILKCNWWFYVDCKSSKSLYDSNIPISKSYQLMKALAFFSAYKNHDNSTADAGAPLETEVS